MRPSTKSKLNIHDNNYCANNEYTDDNDEYEEYNDEEEKLKEEERERERQKLYSALFDSSAFPESLLMKIPCNCPLFLSLLHFGAPHSVLSTILLIAERTGKIQELLESETCFGYNCLMLLIEGEHPLDTIQMFLEYCKKYANLEKLLWHRTCSDWALSLAAVRNDFTADFTLKLLIAYFPSNELFKEVLNSPNCNGIRILDMDMHDDAYDVLVSPFCWKNCCNWLQEFDATIWDTRKNLSNAFASGDDYRVRSIINEYLEDENEEELKRVFLAKDYRNHTILTDACQIWECDEPMALYPILETAVDLGIIRELLESSIDREGNLPFMSVAYEMPIEWFKLLFHYYWRYADLRKLFRIRNDEGMNVIENFVDKFFNSDGMEQVKLFIAIFPSNEMVRSMLIETSAKRTGKMVKDSAPKGEIRLLFQHTKNCWRICYDWALKFKFHDMTMRDILRKLIKTRTNNKKQSISNLSSTKSSTTPLPNSENDENDETLGKILSHEKALGCLAMTNERKYNILHSACCCDLKKSTLNLLLDLDTRRNTNYLWWLLEQTTENGDNCLMLAASWFSFESFRVLFDFCLKNCDMKKMSLERNLQGLTCFSILALRRSDDLRFVKFVLSQTPSKELAQQLINDVSPAVKLVLPRRVKRILEDDKCWEKCCEWFKRFEERGGEDITDDDDDDDDNDNNDDDDDNENDTMKEQDENESCCYDHEMIKSFMEAISSVFTQNNASTVLELSIDSIEVKNIILKGAVSRLTH